MIRIENVETYGWEAAVRGMRNPMNSWAKSDSINGCFTNPEDCKICPFVDPENNGTDGTTIICHNEKDVPFILGKNDLDLMQRLFKAGTEHRKYARMLTVTMDITAPLYWWKEYDTYKVGTVANSCSTMHKIADHEFTLDDFSHEHLEPDSIRILTAVIDKLNRKRKSFIDMPSNYTTAEKKKHEWWQMIQLLPSSYNQRRTVQFSYENAFTFRRHRKNHKLDEWHVFCDTILELPWYREITEE